MEMQVELHVVVTVCDGVVENAEVVFTMEEALEQISHHIGMPFKSYTQFVHWRKRHPTSKLFANLFTQTVRFTVEAL